jgi:hypothetical protein
MSLQINVCVAVSCDQVLRNIRVALQGLGLHVYWLCRYLGDPGGVSCRARGTCVVPKFY